MSTVEKSIDVDVPVGTAYNQWTQFESFPQFMGGVEEIRQTSETHTHWKTSVGGVTREFDAEITVQEPDTKVAWRSTDGESHAGTVSFRPLGPASTRVEVVMEWQPEGIVEKVGDTIGVLDRQVEGDLERFKSFIESRGAETGGWRGEVHGNTVTGS